LKIKFPISVHKTNHLFTDNIKDEYLITKEYSRVKCFEKPYYLHHCYKGQPYDVTIINNYCPLNFEIKNDAKSLESKNLFFEFLDTTHKKLSGFKVDTYNQIHYWLHLSGETLFEFEAQKLKHFLDAYDHKPQSVWGKDKKTGKTYITTWGVIVPREQLIEQSFTNTFTINSDALDYHLIPTEYETLLKK
jgi:hypothetical protein